MIAYMVNPSLHVNKAFKEQSEKCTNDMFDTVTQKFNKLL